MQHHTSKYRDCTAGGELFNPDVVCRVEIACAIKGKVDWAEQSRAGEDRAESAAGELLNRAAGVICHVEIARAIKG